MIKSRHNIIGWMSKDECELLFECALVAPLPRVLEMGSFCGKSSSYIAEAMEQRDGLLICCDYFPKNQRFCGFQEDITIDDTYKAFWDNMEPWKKYVITIKGDVKNIKNLHGQFGMVFIDGGHTAEDILPNALYAWDKVVDGGYIAFHDYKNKVWTDVEACVDTLCKIWKRKIVKKKGLLAVIKK